MIKKNRLEELIKEGATIYDISGKYVGQRILHRLCWVDDDTLYFDRSDECELAYMNDLFETRKQAEWSLKYHATRTEELELPMWEEWCENIRNYCEQITFSDIHYNNYEMFVDSNSRIDDETIIITKYPSGQYIFIESNTQENYEKACDFCVKLFKGEE